MDTIPMTGDDLQRMVSIPCEMTTTQAFSRDASIKEMKRISDRIEELQITMRQFFSVSELYHQGKYDEAYRLCLECFPDDAYLKDKESKRKTDVLEYKVVVSIMLQGMYIEADRLQREMQIRMGNLRKLQMRM